MSLIVGGISSAIAAGFLGAGIQHFFSGADARDPDLKFTDDARKKFERDEAERRQTERVSRDTTPEPKFDQPVISFGGEASVAKFKKKKSEEFVGARFGRGRGGNNPPGADFESSDELKSSGSTPTAAPTTDSNRLESSGSTPTAAPTTDSNDSSNELEQSNELKSPTAAPTTDSSELEQSSSPSIRRAISDQISRGSFRRGAIGSRQISEPRPGEIIGMTDPTRTTDNVRMVQIANASYLRELNKFNTTF